MKTTIAFLLLCLSAISAPQNSRTWTNKEGKTLEGAYREMQGDKALIMLDTGKIVTLNPATLSQQDLNYIKELQGKSTEPQTPEAAGVKIDRKAVWHTKIDKAMEESKATKLPVFILITGSDWCPHCIVLEKEVLSTKAFKEFANQNLVLFIADYPSGGPRKSLKKQNDALCQKLNSRGYPDLFLDDGTFENSESINRYQSSADFIDGLKAKFPTIFK